MDALSFHEYLFLTAKKTGRISSVQYEGSNKPVHMERSEHISFSMSAAHGSVNGSPFVHPTAHAEPLKGIQKSRILCPCFIYKELFTISNEAIHADPRVHRSPGLSYNGSLIKTCFFSPHNLHAGLRILYSANKH